MLVEDRAKYYLGVFGSVMEEDLRVGGNRNLRR